MDALMPKLLVPFRYNLVQMFQLALNYRKSKWLTAEWQYIYAELVV